MASFSAFFTTLLIYSPNVMVIRGADAADYTGFFAPPLLVCTMLVAVAVIVWSGHRARPRLSVRARHALAAALVLMYLVGSGGFSLVLLLQPAAGPALSLACALLASASTICVCVLWARCLSDVGLSGAIVRIAIASGISACCNSFVGHCLGAAGAEVAYLALLLAGMAWPVATALARPGSPTCSCERPADARDSQERPAVRSPRRLRAFLSVMGVPLLGMAISSFAMGVQPAYLFDGALDAQHLGMVVGAVALLPFATLRGKRPIFSFVYQVYLPAFAAVSLVLCSFPVGSVVYECGLASIYVFYSMVSVVAIAAACAVANAGEFSRTTMFAALVGIFCGMGILGIFLGGSVANLIENNALVLVVLTAVYGCWLLFSGCLNSWRLTLDAGDLLPGGLLAAAGDQAGAAGGTGRAAVGGGGPVGVDGGEAGLLHADTVAAPVSAESFDEHLARLASTAGLSPREAEVLSFVGRGHSSVYVAKTLLISESTVYTHVRNLYRKLGVTSREELIQLLNSRA